MLRPFFYNARTWGPTQARNIIFLVKPDHQEWRRAWQVGLYYRRKAGGPARLRSGGRGPTGIAARSTSHSLRYAALRSDWVRWLMEAR